MCLWQVASVVTYDTSSGKVRQEHCYLAYLYAKHTYVIATWIYCQVLSQWHQIEQVNTESVKCKLYRVWSMFTALWAGHGMTNTGSKGVNQISLFPPTQRCQKYITFLLFNTEYLIKRYSDTMLTCSLSLDEYCNLLCRNSDFIERGLKYKFGLNLYFFLVSMSVHNEIWWVQIGHPGGASSCICTTNKLANSRIMMTKSSSWPCLISRVIIKEADKINAVFSALNGHMIF